MCAENLPVRIGAGKFHPPRRAQRQLPGKVTVGSVIAGALDGAAAGVAGTPKPQFSIAVASLNRSSGLVAALCRTTPMSTWPLSSASNSRQYPAALVEPVLIPVAPA